MLNPRGLEVREGTSMTGTWRTGLVIIVALLTGLLLGGFFHPHHKVKSWLAPLRADDSPSSGDEDDDDSDDSDIVIALGSPNVPSIAIRRDSKQTRPNYGKDSSQELRLGSESG